MQQATPAPSEHRKSPPLEHSSQPAATAEGHPVDYPVPPQNNGSAPFYVLSALFDRLQNERKPEKRRKLLDTWFNHWREEKGYDLYPVLRLILPQKDRERAVYGLKEKNLAKIYIKLIPLQAKDPDAIRLLDWKKPTEKDTSSGDFPTVLYEVISKRSSVIQGSLSIEELNDILDSLAMNIGKSGIQSRIMQKVYNRTTPEEQRWIVRVVLKDMIISVKETTVFSVFHPDAHDLFNTCSDLKKVTWELWDPKRRLNDEEKAVSLFRAFAPMLCKRPTKRIEESVKEMGGSKFIIEEKLDGERMQLHKRGNEYFYCSRKGKDYTYLYGKHVGTGSLTPYIDAAFDSRVDEIVLDGEMLVWDPVSERNLPFGTLKTAALDKSKKDYNPRPCFKVFDLLYLNGQSLLQRSLKFRKRNLKACLTEVKGRLELSVEFEGQTAQDVRQRMEDVMNNRGEGLVMKHPDSEYVLNGRNKDWIKVKPEYMDNMGETVDVLVVAGNYGTGRRSGGVSTLICAVLDDRRQLEEDEEPKYSSFVRIGTGLSFADYMWVRQRPWKEWDKKHPPTWLLTSKRGTDDKGDIYLEPHDSFILKIKAAEITPSDQYHLGYTMRFPRATLIREDLGTEDCMMASALFELIRAGKKRKIEDDTEDGTKKKRKTAAKKAAVLPQFQVMDMKNVKVKGELFKGMKFMVASNPKSRTGEEDKKELLKLIKADGGSFVQIVGKNKTDVIVIYGGETTPYDIKLIMDRGTVDIVRPEWIKDSVAKATLMPFKKKYFFFASGARNVDSDDDDEAAPDAEAAPSPTSSKTEPEDEDMAEPKVEERVKEEPEEDTDPSLADWFKVENPRVEKGKGKAVAEDDSETESETDPGSDNEDVRDDDEVLGDEKDQDDEWVNAPTPSAAEASRPMSQTMRSENENPATPDVKMGEDDTAMEYDTDLIFRQLCFYLDSPSNAKKNGMTVKSKNEAQIEQSFQEISKKIIANGGKVVNLDEAKLTHVVLDKRDTARRVELTKRTSKPKRRNLVVADFISACLEEESLLDEDSFAP